jgi:hypothetical protein
MQRRRDQKVRASLYSLIICVFSRRIDDRAGDRASRRTHGRTTATVFVVNRRAYCRTGASANKRAASRRY